MARKTPSFVGLQPTSKQASKAARGASRKTDSKCEIRLRKLLWHQGCRFRKNVVELPGKPDVVFTRARVVIFCDGDFWHGKDWEARQAKLRRGSNPAYWVAKIKRNMDRDQRDTRLLIDQGWTVLRLWESDILGNPQRIVRLILEVLDQRGHRQRLTRP